MHLSWEGLWYKEKAQVRETRIQLGDLGCVPWCFCQTASTVITWKSCGLHLCLVGKRFWFHFNPAFFFFVCDFADLNGAVTPALLWNLKALQLVCRSGETDLSFRKYCLFILIAQQNSASNTRGEIPPGCIEYGPWQRLITVKGLIKCCLIYNFLALCCLLAKHANPWIFTILPTLWPHNVNKFCSHAA